MSRMVHFIPTTSRASAADVANLFVTYVWKLHGLPPKTISDCGPQFNSAFLKQLYKRLDIKPSLSTAFRPQMDGLAEHLNQVVEIYLQHYMAYRQDNWVGILSMAEFAYKNSVNTSTNQTLFFACYGFHPRFSTWEPLEHLDTAMGAVQKFHRENPKALRHPDLEEGVVSQANRRCRH
ncbi:Retrotransposable element Tf2 protein [Ceratobasidium sp. AG-Ba]|nr:Retrotransposable element Tf2 protein [Ceratobasidium sp. AG-Ba]